VYPLRKINAYDNQIINSNITGFLATNEKEILNYILKGYSNQMIAEKMFISEATVRNYLQKIYVKIGTTSKVDTVVNIIYKDILSLI
jgi:DNA-binding NarL/FixJ family response regulator